MTLDDLALDELPQPLIGNKAVEDAAIEFVLRLEREAGRSPIDRRYVHHCEHRAAESPI
jgi:hypothetical protein